MVQVTIQQMVTTQEIMVVAAAEQTGQLADMVQVLKAVTEERVIKTLAAEHNVLAAAVAVWVVLATMVHQVLEVTEDQE